MNSNKRNYLKRLEELHKNGELKGLHILKMKSMREKLNNKTKKRNK
jgi:hypothetical protein